MKFTKMRDALDRITYVAETGTHQYVIRRCEDYRWRKWWVTEVWTLKTVGQLSPVAVQDRLIRSHLNPTLGEAKTEAEKLAAADQGERPTETGQTEEETTPVALAASRQRYPFGSFVVRPDGELDVVEGSSGSDEAGRAYRLRWCGPTWFDEGAALRPATYADFCAASLGTDVRSTTASKARAVTQGPQGCSRGAGAHVFTPCCGAGHYMAEPYGQVTCRGCGWHYLAQYFSAGTFFMSLGYGVARRRRSQSIA